MAAAAATAAVVVYVIIATECADHVISWTAASRQSPVR